MKKWGLVLVLILGLNIAFVKEVKADCTMPVRADINGDGIVGLTETKTIYRAEGHSVCSFDAPTAKINVTNDYTVCSQETFTPDESGVTGKEYLYTCTSSGFQKQTHLWTSKSCGGTLGLSGTACINNISTTDFADAENDAGCMSSPTCTSYDGTKIDSEDWGCYNETSYARCWRGKFVCIQTCNNGKCKLKNDSVYRYKCYDQPCPDYGISSGENTCAKDNTGALRVVVKCVDGEVSKTTCESNELCVEKDGISSCTSTLTNNLCTQDEDGNEMSAAVTNGDTVCYNNKISVCTTVPKIETVKDGDCTSKQETCYNTKETGFVPKCLTKDGAEGLGINTSVTVDISTDTGFMCDVNSSINSDSEGGSGDDNDGVSTAFGCIPITASGLANKLLPILFGIAGGISFLRMVLGFIMIATSSGDEKKFIEAKSIISSAIIGLLVSIFAIFLFRLIFVNILQIPGLS